MLSSLIWWAIPAVAVLLAGLVLVVSRQVRARRADTSIDPHLAAYAERLVEAGKAPSVSAVVNGALEAERQRDQKARRLWREAAEHADPDKVARMLAHVEAQAAQLPESHRYR